MLRVNSKKTVYMGKFNSLNNKIIAGIDKQLRWYNMQAK